MWGTAAFVYFDGQTLGCQVRDLDEALSHFWNNGAAAMQYNSSDHSVVKSYLRYGGMLREVDLKEWFERTHELSEPKRRHLKRMPDVDLVEFDDFKARAQC